MSFFLFLIYSESLFIVLSLTAILLIRNKFFFWAGFIIALAMFTRIVGLALIPYLIIELYKNKHKEQINSWWSLVPIAVGLIILKLFVTNLSGTNDFLQAQSNYWQRNITIPGQNIFQIIELTSKTRSISEQSMEFIFSIIGLGLVLRGFRYIRFSYVVYCFLFLLIPLSTNQLTSMPRFLLPVFIIYPVIALSFSKHQKWFYLTGFVFAILNVVYCIRYFGNYWVA